MDERSAGRKCFLHRWGPGPAALALVALVVVLLAGVGPGRAEQPNLTPAAFLPAVVHEPTPSPGPTPVPSDDPALEREVLRLINLERTRRGLAALQQAEAITQAARRHSRDMADHDFFSHTGSDGSNAGQRLSAAGYQWSAWGEIIAAGHGTAEAVVEAWMNSDGHRAIILSATYVDFGAGYATSSGSTYGRYWTVDFGRPDG